MANSYSSIFKTLKSMGIGTGKGSKSWRAGFEQALKDNNITSEEDISALRQHIEDKFSAAKSGGTHDDGRFAGVMSYEDLGGSIWNKGQIAAAGDSLKFLSSRQAGNHSIVKEAEQRRAQLDQERAKRLEKKSQRDLEDIATNAVNMVQKGTMSQKALNEMSTASPESGQAVLKAKLGQYRDAYRSWYSPQAREALEKGIDPIRDIKEQLRNNEERSLKQSEESSRAYWNDEARVKVYERSYANAQRNLDEKGTINPNNKFVQLQNNEKAITELQKYNPSLYERLGFGQKALEEDLAEQEAYQYYYQERAKAGQAVNEVMNDGAPWMQYRFTAEEAKAQATEEERLQRLYDTARGKHVLNEQGINEQTLQAETDRLYEARDFQENKAKNKEIGAKAVEDAAKDSSELIEDVGGYQPYFHDTKSNEYGIETGFNESQFLDLIKSNTKGWGSKGGAKRALAVIKEDYTDRINSIMANSELTAEQRAKQLAEARIEALGRAQSGASFSDVIFGNKVHTGAIGTAALVATYGVAFSGQKSNAELYGSPF